MDIGKRIKEIRKAQGLTQREVARRAGLSPSGVGFIELGQTQRPSAMTVVAIAGVLGVPVEELLAEEPASPKSEGLQREVARWLSERSDHRILEPYEAWAGRVAKLDLKGARAEGYRLDADTDELKAEAKKHAAGDFALGRELRKQIRHERTRKVAALRRYLDYLEDLEQDDMPADQALQLLVQKAS